ncbi:hypothetical protein BM221_006302 [Beauveria bassiana]|uniref:Uncharacterized protein n=1 Tax=Beauveria bassiana TaxID=176275 RepID=A0A2N6NLH5_BEABA|nr:hypothetical protein BM221_006302 [Beauveria bassiana]
MGSDFPEQLEMRIATGAQEHSPYSLQLVSAAGLPESPRIAVRLYDRLVDKRLHDDWHVGHMPKPSVRHRRTVGSATVAPNQYTHDFIDFFSS